ncbi:MAG: hypothetical protein ACXABY_26125 [Candidatus Thorarchaeota archaeon]|jgi:hypothetical protein
MNDWTLTKLNHPFLLSPPGKHYTPNAQSVRIDKEFAWIKQGGYFVLATGKYAGWHCDDASWEHFANILSPLEQLALAADSDLSPPEPSKYPDYV